MTGWGTGWRWHGLALLNKVENHLHYLRDRAWRLLKGRGWHGPLFQLLIQLDAHFTNMPEEGEVKRQKEKAKIFLADLNAQR